MVWVHLIAVVWLDVCVHMYMYLITENKIPVFIQKARNKTAVKDAVLKLFYKMSLIFRRKQKKRQLEHSNNSKQANNSFFFFFDFRRYLQEEKINLSETELFFSSSTKIAENILCELW